MKHAYKNTRERRRVNDSTFSNRETLAILMLCILSMISFFRLPLLACVSITALSLFALMKIVRPAYAFYDMAHVYLTEAAIDRLVWISRKKELNYSSCKEVLKFLGEPPYDGELERTQGIKWGCIAEDYLGDGADKDTAIVKHHYYDPDPRFLGCLSDFVGGEAAIPGLSEFIIRMAAGSRWPAPNRAWVWWEVAKKAYEHGSIRDAYSYLGRAIHLFEDMACPAHARNDNHLGALPVPRVTSMAFWKTFPEYDDHLDWDSLEQFCEGDKSPVKLIMFVSEEENEFLKYFPIVSQADTFHDYTNTTEGKMPYLEYIKREISKLDEPLSENELSNCCNSDVLAYIVKMATDTGKDWFSDDTIPGNLTRQEPHLSNFYHGVGEEKTKQLAKEEKGLILDAWKKLFERANINMNEIEIKEKIEEYVKIENVLRELEPEFLVRAINTNLTHDEMGEWIKGLPADRAEKLQSRLLEQWQEKIWGLWDSYQTFQFMRPVDELYNERGLMLPRTKKDYPWTLLLRRRYRLTTKYLKAIMKNQVPIVTERAAALIQRFYDNVRHVDLRKEHEKREGDWRDKPIIMEMQDPKSKHEKPNYIWLENCGGVEDDFFLEIDDIPEGYEVKVEKESGCERVEGDMEGNTWRGTIFNVDPTPKEVADKGSVHSPTVIVGIPYRIFMRAYVDKPQLDWEIPEYKPFDGERGAKLKITIIPPKKEENENI